MSNALQAAAAWLHAQRERHASIDVIVDNGESTVTVPATMGRADMPRFDSEGVAVNVATRDFLINRDRLVFDGVKRLPAKGWKITAAIGGRTFVYQVNPRDDGKWFRYSDTQTECLRIFTTLLSSTLTP